MTTELTRILRQEADTAVATFDATDVLAAGRRRLVRGRVLRGAAATVVAVSATLVGLAVMAPDAPRSDPPVATQSMETLSYAAGPTLVRDAVHVDGLDMGTPILCFVRVPAGTVFVGSEGQVRLLPPHSKESVTIGHTSAEHPHLVADPTHNQVGWVMYPDGSAPSYVVYDVARRERRASWPESDRPWTFSPERARIYALDGDRMFRLDSRGAVEVDLRTGRTTVLDEKASGDTIGSASGGKVAWTSAGSSGYLVGDRYGKGVPMRRHDSPMLSTAGTYLSTDDTDQVHVQRTDDGSDVTPSLPASYTRAMAYGWSDDDHLLVAAVPGRLDMQHVVDMVFLTCSVSSGRCEESGEGHAYPATLRFPVGEPSGRLTHRSR